VAEQDLETGGRRRALAALEERDIPSLLDLDDPRNLVERTLRPSGVATRNRRVTRRLALSVFEEGVAGFEWWSTIEASWINVTLFAERVLGNLRLIGEPEVLTLGHPAVRQAAEATGILLP
jgi:hypothetical protein